MKNNNLLAALTATLLLCFGADAHSSLLNYTVSLDGPSEFPVNASPGIGSGLLGYDNVAHTLSLQVTFSGLLGPTTASHIHAPTSLPFTGTAGVATTTPSFALFPLGVTSGSFSNTLDLTLASSYNPAYVAANGGTTAGAEAALAAAFASGKAYWNIHTQSFPGGEIRGFVIPEPTTILFGLGVAGVCLTSGLKALKRKSAKS